MHLGEFSHVSRRITHQARESAEARVAVAPAEEQEEGAWVAPSWMEYQTDSDDSDGTASRKKDLKARDRISAIHLGDSSLGDSSSDLGACPRPRRV